jgi:uncharacterized damage-inducible protein DinB
MRIVHVIIAVTALSGVAGAQEAGKGDIGTVARVGFEEVAGNLAKSAALIPADKFDYRPVATVRTVGQLVAHVVDGYNFYCARAAGEKYEWTDATEKGALDKTTLVAALAKAQERCQAVYARSQSPMLMGNVAHSNLHYGNLITYIRMLGLVPPSS